MIQVISVLTSFPSTPVPSLQLMEVTVPGVTGSHAMTLAVIQTASADVESVILQSLNAEDHPVRVTVFRLLTAQVLLLS